MPNDAVLAINISQTADPEYTAAFETVTDEGDAASVGLVIDLDSEVGTASLVITPQVSVDKQNWIDRASLPALTAVGQTEVRCGSPLRFMRFKLVLSGSSSPAFVGTIKATPSNKQIDVPESVLHGTTVVTTAATEVILAASQVVKSVSIKAKLANTGKIFVGGAGVSSADGYPLEPGESVSFDISNLANVWIDSAVSGEGVNYIAVK